MIVTFGNSSQNNEDLIECKMALRQLLISGADEDCIAELENEGMFGNLDVNAVVEEMMVQA